MDEHDPQPYADPPRDSRESHSQSTYKPTVKVVTTYCQECLAPMGDVCCNCLTNKPTAFGDKP